MFLECVLLSTSLCHAVKDRPVMALTAVHFASATADIITTKQFERRGFVELEWPQGSRFILGQRPTVGRMALVDGGELILEMWIAQRLHQSHSWIRHVWWLPQIVSVGFHTHGSVHNSQL